MPAAPTLTGFTSACHEWAAGSDWQKVDIISDLHLCPELPKTFAAWKRMMLESSADAIVILGDLAGKVKEVQDSAEGGAGAVPVIISARKDVRYEAVVKIMDTLQRAGIARVGLSVRTTGG